VTWVINPAVGCHYFPPGLQLPSQPLRGLLPILLLGEQRHNWCEQFACYPTASRLRFEPGPFCAWVQHANRSATEPPLVTVTVVNTNSHDVAGRGTVVAVTVTSPSLWTTLTYIHSRNTCGSDLTRLRVLRCSDFQFFVQCLFMGVRT